MADCIQYFWCIVHCCRIIWNAGCGCTSYRIGLFLRSASAVAYIISCYVLLAVDSEKWAIAQSPETLPDLEIMVTALVPALLAAVVQFSKKRAATGEPSRPLFENVSVSTAEESTDAEDTENGTASEEAQDDMQDDTQG